MNDPARWRSPDGDAPSEAKELLRHAAAPRAFDAAARARNAAAIAKISAGAAAAQTTTLFGAKLVAKVGLAALVAISAGVSMQRVRARRDGHHAPAVARVTSPVASPALVAAPPERAARVAAPTPTPDRGAVADRSAEPPAPTAALPQIAPERAPVAPVVAPPVAHPRVVAHREPAVAAPVAAGGVSQAGYAPPHVVPTMAAPAEALERETGLIGAAVGSFDRDPQGALAALDRHAREFPSGQMAAEREFLAVRLLRSLGRESDARARADALATRYPSSPYAARARRLFDTTP